MLFHQYYAAALRLGWFDPCFYFDQLQSRGISIAAADLSLFEHYATVGWKRGLSPSDRFSVPAYLARHEDVDESRVDPLYHYLTRGRRERRRACPLIEPADEVQLVGISPVHPTGRENALHQALARANGISAFCMGYDTSREHDVAGGIDPETPFCLYLDHGDRAGAGADTSLAAQYSLVHGLLEVLHDPRYIRVRGKPLLLVCHPGQLEEPPLTFDLWREMARGAGLGGLFVIGRPDGGAGKNLGLDGLLEAPAAPWDAVGHDRLSATLPVFPGFMPDRAPSAWPDAGARALDVFAAWSASAAVATEGLYRDGLPRLAFIDARVGRADGWQDFLKGAAPAPERGGTGLSGARRFADAIASSSRLPLLFVCDRSSDHEVIRRLVASLGERETFECFELFEAGEFRASSFSLSELDEVGWDRGQKVEYLAGLLRGRGDLVVVSSTSAMAGLLAPFAARGQGTVSVLQERAAGVDLDQLGHDARCIIASSRAAHEQVIASGAIAPGDIRVIEPPHAAEPTQAWTRYVDEIATCLTGLGNDARRLRSTGRTLGRQAVADDLCVVIPSYNHKPYVVAALDSVLAQSLRPREIRIIDDGSDDGSADLVRSLASDDLGIFVETRENRGAQATINEGIAETRCPIVAVMNSDDRWHPLRIEHLIGHLRGDDGADVVFSRLRFMGPRHRSEEKRIWYERGIADYNAGSPLWQALMFCNFFFTSSNLIARRDKFIAVGGFGPLRYCHDLDYMLNAVFAGQTVRFEQRTLCDYRLHARNTIDEDLGKVLFEEAWIIVKSLRRGFGRFSEAERLTVARRVCDKGLASRVVGLLRAVAHSGAPFDDKIAYTDPRFVEVLEQNHPRIGIGPEDLVPEIARLVMAQGADPVPTASA